jgi:hypothetical protein
MDLSIVKITKNAYRIANKKGKSLCIELENLNSMFGVEEFSNYHYVNWTLDEDTASMFKNLERDIKNTLLDEDSSFRTWTWTSNIRIKPKFDPLLKTRFKQTKNKFIINYTGSIFEIDYTECHNIELQIDTLWTNEKTKTFGVLFYIKGIDN